MHEFDRRRLNEEESYAPSSVFTTAFISTSPEKPTAFAKRVEEILIHTHTHTEPFSFSQRVASLGRHYIMRRGLRTM